MTTYQFSPKKLMAFQVLTKNFMIFQNSAKIDALSNFSTSNFVSYKNYSLWIYWVVLVIFSIEQNPARHHPRNIEINSAIKTHKKLQILVFKNDNFSKDLAKKN